MRNSSRKFDLKKYSPEEQKVLHWRDFQPQQCAMDGMSASAIACHLRQLLESYEESEFIKYLVAPSPTALSGFFQCEEGDIYQALQELERQGYGTEACGDLGPVILWDPLIRNKTIRHYAPNAWQLIQEMFNQPSNQRAIS